MNRVLNGDIPSPRDSRPDISPELERICMKSLAYEADARYSTAEELQTELDAALGQLSASITLRDIGQFVSRHFEDSRVRTRQVIEQQLKEASLAVADGKGPVSFPPPPVSMLQRTYTGSGTNSAVAAPPEAGGTRKLFVFLLLLVLGVAGIVMFQRWRAPRNDNMADLNPATRSSAPAVKSAAPDSSSAHSDQIMVRITVFPLAAKILLDDKPLDSNPYVGFVSIDQSSHRVDAQAPGYASASTAVTFNRNVEVVLTLVEDKAPKPTGGHRWSRPPPKPTAEATTSRPPPRNNCDPPFYVDDRGVKKFKPGCL
jgi:serine/threonine-protein kinase